MSCQVSNAPSCGLLQNSFPKFFAYVLTRVDAVFRGLSGYELIFVGETSIDSAFSQIPRNLSTHARVLSPWRNFISMKIDKKIRCGHGFCREFICLSFKTNRASNRQAIAEKSRRYWLHSIFAKNRVRFCSHRLCLNHSPTKALLKALIFLS